jgi:hypothetical protein
LLDGGAGDDLLIAGPTSYDNNLAALNSLMAEWGRTDATYATRVAHLDGSLTTGSRNGAIKLTASTVFDDGGASDSLTGGAGLDAYWASVGDNITDLNFGGTEIKKII